MGKVRLVGTDARFIVAMSKAKACEESSFARCISRAQKQASAAQKPARAGLDIKQFLERKSAQVSQTEAHHLPVSLPGPPPDCVHGALRTLQNNGSGGSGAVARESSLGMVLVLYSCLWRGVWVLKRRLDTASWMCAGAARSSGAKIATPGRNLLDNVSEVWRSASQRAQFTL